MFKVKGEGSYYELGLIQGKMIKEEGLPGDFLEEPTKEKLAFANEMEQLARQYTPDLLEELQGIADGSDFDYDVIKIIPLCLYAGPRPQSCSVVALSGKYTENGKPLFIRNYDYFADSEEGFTTFWIAPKNSYASVGFCDFFHNRYGGFNERGLAIAISISATYPKGPELGIVFSLATRWALDKCATTKEAVEFLEKIPHFHCFMFTILDKNNNIARVETSPQKVHTTYLNDGIAISTNHYLSKEMQEIEEPKYKMEGSTISRYDNALNWFQNRKEPITHEYASKLAKSHEKGLCDHFTAGEKRGGTVWSWIYSIGESEVQVVQGPPCKNNYQKLKTNF